MYRIMLVDDEKVFRDGLRQNIDWGKYNLSVVAEAQNGKEALDMLDISEPNIVITDILMPEMDGLELAEHIHQTHPDVKVIMLTVMDGFAETRRSLRAQVVDYVLKFHYQEEVLPAVLKACGMIERERWLLLNQSNKHSRTVAFLRECIVGNLSEEEVRNLLQKEHPELDGMHATVLLATLPGQNVQMEATAYLDIQTELKELKLSDFYSYLIDLGSKLCMILLMRQFDKSGALQHGRTVLRRLRWKNRAYSELSIGIGSIKEGLSALAVAYGEAQVALSMGLVNNADMLFYFQLQGDDASYQVLMQKAAEFIDNNYQNSNLGLKEISDQFHLSPPYFSSVFKRAFGMGFNEYLTKVRLNHAKRMLENTSLRTYEIAERVGYSSPQYMSILFKRYFSCTPGDYRRLHGHVPTNVD